MSIIIGSGQIYDSSNKIVRKNKIDGTKIEENVFSGGRASQTIHIDYGYLPERLKQQYVILVRPDTETDENKLYANPIYKDIKLCNTPYSARRTRFCYIYFSFDYELDYSVSILRNPEIKITRYNIPYKDKSEYEDDSAPKYASGEESTASTIVVGEKLSVRYVNTQEEFENDFIYTNFLFGNEGSIGGKQPYLVNGYTFYNMAPKGEYVDIGIKRNSTNNFTFYVCTLYSDTLLTQPVYQDSLQTISIDIDISSDSFSSQNIKTNESGRNIFSLNSNELINEYTTVNGNKISNYISDNVIKDYKNGKETATIRCSISDYYDEDGTKVISKDGSTGRMSFNPYDKVIPMKYGHDGVDRPMSFSNDGKPKVFNVIGTKMIYDGAVWQELTLQEV